LDLLTSLLPAQQESPAAVFELGPLDADGAVEALTAPTEPLALEFAEGTAERLIYEIMGVPQIDPSEMVQDSIVVEPVFLQIVATALWNGLRDKDTVIANQMLPDAELTLSEHYSRILGAITLDHKLPTCEIGTWLRRAFITPEGERALVPHRDRPAEMTDSIIRALTDQYLIKSTLRDDGEACLVLRHPRMVPAVMRLSEVGLLERQRDPLEALADAELAWCADDLLLARRHALTAARTQASGHEKAQARAESLLGDISFKCGWTEAAERHYRVAAGMYERLLAPVEAGRMLAAIGRIKLARGNLAEAVDELNNATQRAHNDPHVKIGLSLVFLANDKVSAALSLLDEVLKEGNIGEARQIRGEIYADLGEADKALRDLNQIDLHGRPTARAAKALALTILLRGRTAPDDLDEIVDAAPGNGLVLLRAMRISLACGDRSRAVQFATSAVQAMTPPLTQRQREEALAIVTES
jgi:tetratricopeptide (TPR) repeat protein